MSTLAPVPHVPTSSPKIDDAVRKVTAFRSWADMRLSMVAHGYIPTLNGRSTAMRAVHAACDAEALPYFDGRHMRHMPRQPRPAPRTWTEIEVRWAEIAAELVFAVGV